MLPQRTGEQRVRITSYSKATMTITTTGTTASSAIRQDRDRADPSPTAFTGRFQRLVHRRDRDSDESRRHEPGPGVDKSIAGQHFQIHRPLRSRISGSSPGRTRRTSTRRRPERRRTSPRVAQGRRSTTRAGTGRTSPDAVPHRGSAEFLDDVQDLVGRRTCPRRRSPRAGSGRGGARLGTSTGTDSRSVRRPDRGALVEHGLTDCLRSAYRSGTNPPVRQRSNSAPRRAVPRRP